MDIATFFELNDITDPKERKIDELHLKRIIANDYSDMYEMFGEGASRTQFFKLKKLFQMWYDACGSSEMSERIKSYGFNDYSNDEPSVLFRDIKDMDDRILCEYEKITHTRDGLYRLRTECILSWYGLSVEEIVNLKKSDLDLENGFIYTNQNRLTIDNHSRQIISKYSSLVLSINYDTYNDYFVKDSEYLVRGTTGKLNVKTIPADFAKYIEKTNGRLRINRKMISANGLIVAAYKHEIDDGIDSISAIKQELRNRGLHEAAYQSYLPYYNKWKKLYAL